MNGQYYRPLCLLFKKHTNNTDGSPCKAADENRFPPSQKPAPYDPLFLQITGYFFRLTSVGLPIY